MIGHELSIWGPAITGSGVAGVVNFDLTGGVLPTGMSFIRGSVATYIDNTGTLRTATANVPRFNYNASGSTLLGLLIEPAATNLLLQSNGFTTTWFATNTDVATAAAFTSPDGTNDGWSDTTGTGFGGRAQAITFSNIPYTFSTWAKNIVGTAQLNLKLNDVQNGGSALSATIARISATLTPSAGANNAVLQQNAASGSTNGIFGAQLETGSAMTSYIPTTTGAATRAADACTFTIPSGINKLTYTFDDNSTQTVFVSPGAYTVPTNLSRPNIKSIVGSALPISYTGNVATRTFVPWLFNGTNKQLMSRSEHISRDTITSLQIVVANWYVDTSNNTGTLTELGTGGTMSVTASVEYPAGTFTQLKFSASATGTATTGNNLVSDALSIAIPNNTEFWIRIWYSNASGGIVYSTQANAGLGDRLSLGVSGVTDLTMSGTVANDNPGFALPPAAIIATTTKRSFFLVGTSRTSGNNDTVDSSGNIGVLARSIGPGFAYTMVGVPGDTAAKFVLSNAKRTALAQSYFSDLVFEYGVNDDPSALATLEANLQTMWGAFPTKRVYAVSIDPNTTSSDSWATLGNQALAKDYSSINTYITGKPVPLRKVFDMASVVGISGKWQVNGLANFYTSDGLHENHTACLAIQASGVVAP